MDQKINDFSLRNSPRLPIVKYNRVHQLRTVWYSGNRDRGTLINVVMKREHLRESMNKCQIWALEQLVPLHLIPHPVGPTIGGQLSEGLSVWTFKCR